MMRPRRSGRQNDVDQAIGWLRLGGTFHRRGLARGRWELEGDYQQFPLWLGRLLTALFSTVAVPIRLVIRPWRRQKFRDLLSGEADRL